MLFHKSVLYNHDPLSPYSNSAPVPSHDNTRSPQSIFPENRSANSFPPSQSLTLPFPAEPRALPQGTGDPDLDQVIKNAGYAYDPQQDIFYSTVNPWQRRAGYCRLYDEASAPMGMIIDCESINFDYNDQKWMVGFWKGQYDLVTGGEIGLYKGAFHYTLPGLFRGMFYKSVSDDEMIPMSFVLKKNGRILLTREDTHWWLTGFKLGEFSQPWELSMTICLTFPEEAMTAAFIGGLKKAGYSKTEYQVSGSSILINFTSPHTKQPTTRTPSTDSLIQAKNKALCEKYLEITGPYNNILDKMKAIENQAPDLYKNVIKIAKSKAFYEIWIKIILLGLTSLVGFKKSIKLTENLNTDKLE
ncbi:DUF4474 domain-containing protein [Dehalobacter sp. DCM]|uniref:DUF4474 domain-containing protein n=1 Tax=Dehalobacter sp. DCM TaxID=2907827 RepID=UPI0030820EBB|nr:DUF4474 domain-containing protein [Dehalobacter sp. DCM]